MISWHTIRTLGGATLLRALETYRLLFTRFWWALALLVGVHYIPLLYVSHVNPERLYDYVLFTGLPATLLLCTIVLLSRSSMVRKDARFVFMSNQTLQIVVWALMGALLVMALTWFAQKFLLVYSVVFFRIISTVLMGYWFLWAYYLLDTQVIWYRYPYILIQSLSRALRLLSHNVPEFAVLMLLSIIEMYVFFYGIRLLENIAYAVAWRLMALKFFIAVLVLFPWYAAAVAVLYENMRYRSEVA